MMLVLSAMSENSSHQLNPVKPKLIAQGTAKDQVLSKVQCYIKEGWLSKLADEMKQVKKLVLGHQLT